MVDINHTKLLVMSLNKTSRMIAAPIRARMALVIDVETTGLLPKKKSGLTINDYPHILQLSFLVYDLFERTVVQTYDTYIRVPDEVEISDKITELTGITRDICNTKGCDIIYALNKLYQVYMQCNIIVAHNMEFDSTMVRVEVERNRERILKEVPHCTLIFNTLYENTNNVDRYCTMRKGVAEIKIATVAEAALALVMDVTVESNYAIATQSNAEEKKKWIKWPRLAELYGALFNRDTPPNMHNSMIDVIVCLRCYAKMRHNIDISDATFGKMLLDSM